MKPSAAVVRLTFGALLATGAPAEARTPAIKPDAPYAQVHAQLAAAGYRPFQELTSGKVGVPSDVARLYPEVVQCAGTGASPCIFVLTRSRNDNIVVYTVGEQAEHISVQSARYVTRAQAEAICR